MTIVNLHPIHYFIKEAFKTDQKFQYLLADEIPREKYMENTNDLLKELMKKMFDAKVTYPEQIISDIDTFHNAIIKVGAYNNSAGTKLSK